MQKRWWVIANGQMVAISSSCRVYVLEHVEEVQSITLIIYSVALYILTTGHSLPVLWQIFSRSLPDLQMFNEIDQKRHIFVATMWGGVWLIIVTEHRRSNSGT